MAGRTLSAAERELLAIYTRQAYDAYLAGSMKETEQKCRQLEALNPGDMHARFLRGALTGRQARPGEDMRFILDAVRYWRPLYEQTAGDAFKAMCAAMDEALTTILYIPVEQASRQWDTYYDERTAHILAEAVRTLLAYEDGYAAREDAYSRWIAERFRSNYVFLADEIIGINKPIPAGGAPQTRAYGEALRETLRMAERIPDNGESAAAVKQNAAQRLQRFQKQNP